MGDLQSLGSSQKIDGVFMTNLPYQFKKKYEKSIILDRDGVLNNLVTRSDGTKGAPWDIKDFHITTEAIKACEILRFHGYLLLVATNQPDLGSGLTLESLNEMNIMMKNYLKVDDILCAHKRGDNYYKPNNGMLEEYVQKYELDRNKSWMVGDKEKDIIAGKKSNLKTILITDKLLDFSAHNDYTANTIWEAAKIIVGRN